MQVSDIIIINNMHTIYSYILVGVDENIWLRSAKFFIEKLLIIIKMHFYKFVNNMVKKQLLLYKIQKKKKKIIWCVSCKNAALLYLLHNTKLCVDNGYG